MNQATKTQDIEKIAQLLDLSVETINNNLSNININNYNINFESNILEYKLVYYY